MNYSGFKEFPFPTTLSREDEKIKNFFFSLSDEEQLRMLNGSLSYELFLDRVSQHMTSAQNIS